MGKEDWKLVLNKNIFYTGETLSGTVVLDLQKTKKINSLFVTVMGKCKVQWYEQKSWPIRRVAHYSSSETYKISNISLLDKQEGKHTIEPGHYEYPFQCVIPADYPSSFEGKHGRIRYKVRVMADRKFFDKQLKKDVFQVIAPLDLNDCPTVREPVCLPINKTYSSLLSSLGSVQALVRLPATGYYPGDTIPIEISYQNDSSVAIERFSLKFTQIIMFRAEGKLRPKTKTLAQACTKPQPDKSGTIRVTLQVPNDPAPNLQNCKNITINYLIKVTMTPSGVHRDSEVSQIIVLGTVPPFTGYSVNPQGNTNM